MNTRLSAEPPPELRARYPPVTIGSVTTGSPLGITHFDTLHAAGVQSGQVRRARGWAVWRAIGCLHIATAGPPGGKPS